MQLLFGTMPQVVFLLLRQFIIRSKDGEIVFRASRMNSFSHSPIFSPRQQITAPSYTLRARLGMTRCSSIPITLPKPSQLGQAPMGELKENIWSLGSSKVIPSASNFVLKEKSCVLPSDE